MSLLHKAYIALGSNLQHPQQQLEQAIASINEHDMISVIISSSFIQTKALVLAGSPPQPDYLNAVIEIETKLVVEELLLVLQGIEQEQGRVRTQKWSARTIDLDILLFDELTITTEKLTVPHSQMCFRHFVLEPLAEIAPDVIIPQAGKVTDVLSLITTKNIS